MATREAVLRALDEAYPRFLQAHEVPGCTSFTNIELEALALRGEIVKICDEKRVLYTRVDRGEYAEVYAQIGDTLRRQLVKE